MVPLLAGPDLLGTLSVGYEVDQALLYELKAMTGSVITVMLGHTVLASTWPRDVHPELLAALTSPVGNPAVSALSGLTSAIRALQIGGETYLTLTVSLALSFLIARQVTAPVQALVQRAAAVARGNYQYRVVVQGMGTVAGIDPCAWKNVNGKFYLNLIHASASLASFFSLHPVK